MRLVLKAKPFSLKELSIRSARESIILICFFLIGSFSSALAQLTIGDATESSVTLRWLAPGDDGTNGTADSYEIRYGSVALDAGNFASANPVSQNLTPYSAGAEQSFELSDLDPQITSFIAMRAYDEAGNQSGITNSVSASPNDGTGTVEVDPNAQAFTVTVSLASGAYEYLFQVDDNPDFTSPITVAGAIDNSSVVVTFEDLSPLNFYYWRYRYHTPDETSSTFYSPGVEVDLTAALADGQPAPPTPLCPANGDTITTLTPAVTVLNGFDLEGDPLTYQFQLFDQSGKMLLLSDSNLVETFDSTSWTVPSGLLSLGELYQWQARCYDGFQYSPWTYRHSFFVENLSSNLTQENFIPDPYPSPVRFLSGDQLTFELPDNPVTLRILNAAGELVFIAADVTGLYTWNGLNGDGHNVASGVYLWYVSDDLGKGKFIVLP